MTSWTSLLRSQKEGEESGLVSPLLLLPQAAGTHNDGPGPADGQAKPGKHGWGCCAGTGGVCEQLGNNALT